jgi:hypothetical protein
MGNVVQLTAHMAFIGGCYRNTSGTNRAQYVLLPAPAVAIGEAGRI